MSDDVADVQRLTDAQLDEIEADANANNGLVMRDAYELRALVAEVRRLRGENTELREHNERRETFHEARHRTVRTLFEAANGKEVALRAEVGVLRTAPLSILDELLADCDERATSGYYRAALLVARRRIADAVAAREVLDRD